MGFPWKPPFTVLGVESQFQFSQGILTHQSPPQPPSCVSHLQGTVPNPAADTHEKKGFGIEPGFSSCFGFVLVGCLFDPGTHCVAR